ncbi:MAG: hypothetical protein NUV84_03295 [Candidatus Uhrbacteria bacterium]|nr:hypothetical protein [Candidatus Uhrbacteria bacterium]
MEESTQITSKTSKTSIFPVLHKATTFDVYQNVLLSAGIADPNEAALALLVIRLAQGRLSVGDFTQTISSEFGVPIATAQSITKAVASRVLAPLEKDLPFALGELIRDPSQDVSLRAVRGSEEPSLRVATSVEPGSRRGGSSLSTDEAISSDKPKEIASPLEELGARNDTGEKVGAKKEDDTKLDEELEGIKQQKAAMIEKTGPLDVPGMVKEICENPLFAFEDPMLNERCTKLIESRVRDVRTPEQTRAQLEKVVESGGLGVSGRRLADMLAFIEGRVTAFQGNLNQEQRQKRIDQRAGASDKAQQAKNEETLMTKRYVELTGKVPSAHIAPAAPSVSRTSVAISAHHEQLAREGKIDTAKVKEAVEGAKQTAVPPRVKATPSMQEVTFEKRLSGPIDELRSLTLTDFRRLSKDPSQAATKVKDKVDIMEEQGYDRVVEAVQAWRGCALNQMYVSLTREAVLTGTSVTELLSRKRIAGEETLSDEELKAIMKLNAELRF